MSVSLHRSRTDMGGQPNQYAKAVKPYMAGLFIDGALHGHHGSDIVLYGMALAWGAQHASDADGVFWQILTGPPSASGGPTGEAFLQEDPTRYEYLRDMAASAETWADVWVAPEGMSFGWYEGDFFLQSVAWWDAVNG